MTAPSAPGQGLSRILGVGFAIALAFGATVGVGVLRLPGVVAAHLGDGRLVILAWLAGGLYATLGAISLGEVAAMSPAAGGFYVYARRAFGPRIGFCVGWNDWILNGITIAFAALTAVDFAGALFPAVSSHPKLLGVAILAVFAGLNWLGLRIGGSVQNALSSLVGLILVALALGCFVLPAAHAGSAIAAHASLIAMAGGMVISLRAVIVTYDGWYSAIYLAEETRDAARAVPHAMISCALLVTGLYVLINLGFLHALGMSRLAGSKLPAADVAEALAPHAGGVVVTVLSLLTILGLINAIMLGAPRILFALGRDGLLGGRTARLADDGNPRVALAVTAAASGALVLSGTLDQLIAVASIIFVLNYLSAYAAVFVLRHREPGAERPFRAWGYPWTTAVVLAGSLAFLGAAVIDDPRSAIFAAGLIALSAPAFWLTRPGRIG